MILNHSLEIAFAWKKQSYGSSALFDKLIPEHTLEEIRHRIHQWQGQAAGNLRNIRQSVTAFTLTSFITLIEEFLETPGTVFKRPPNETMPGIILSIKHGKAR